MHRSKYYKYPVYVPKRKGKLKFPKMLMKRDKLRLKRLKALKLKAAKKAAKLAKTRISGKGGRMKGVKYGPKPAVKGKKKKDGLLKRLVKAVKKGAKKTRKSCEKGSEKSEKRIEKIGERNPKGRKESEKWIGKDCESSG